MNRRIFLAAGGRILGGSALRGLVRVNAPSRRGGGAIKAVLFDAFPVFDPGGILLLAERLYPGNGKVLVDAWRGRQFEYTWLRTVAGSWTDFFSVTSDALDYASELVGLDMGAKEHGLLMEEYYRLQVWPDVLAALQELVDSGYRLGLLSNFTLEMLQTNTDRCGVGVHFSHLLSVDSVRRYKPDRRAYQMGTDIFRVGAEEILFVASAGWDAWGASQFGYETFWVNRSKAPPEKLGMAPDGVGKDMNDLVNYLRREN